MTRTTSQKSRAWFWVGVALLSISALFWMAIISIIVDDPQEIGLTILAGISFSAVLIGTGIYCVWRARKAPAATPVQQTLQPIRPIKDNLKIPMTGEKPFQKIRSVEGRPWLRKIKRFSVRGGIPLLSLFLIIGALLIPDGVKEVTNVDKPWIILFQSGYAWLQILLYIFLMLVGGGLLVVGFITLRVIFGERQPEERNKLKRLGIWFGMLVFALMMLAMGAFLLAAPFWSWSYSESITVDKSLMTIEVKKNFFLRDETLHFAWWDISYIEWSQQYKVGQGDWVGEVIIILGDGTEVELSHNGSQAQHELARRIAEFTDKELIENY